MSDSETKQNAAKQNGKAPADSGRMPITIRVPDWWLFAQVQEGLIENGQELDGIDSVRLEKGEYVVDGWSEVKR